MKGLDDADNRPKPPNNESNKDSCDGRLGSQLVANRLDGGGIVGRG